MDAEEFDTIVADEAAEYLRGIEAADQGPRRGECLRCYLDRMVIAHGCDDTTRFTRRWLTWAGMPDPKAVAEWLEAAGGYCDCEVIATALPEHWPWPPAGVGTGRYAQS